MFTRLLNKLWFAERWPSTCRKGLIVTILKKSGMREKLRKEKAGFRPMKGTTEQMFTLMNILRTYRKLLEYYERLWNTRQNGANNS